MGSGKLLIIYSSASTNLEGASHIRPTVDTTAVSFTHYCQLGASFFFKRGEGDRGNTSKFFTTIAV